MFPNYNSLAEVPEAFREHYVMKGAKAVPEVSPDHPLLTNNATLVSEKTEAERQRDEAKRELESAKASNLPRGHKAVPNTDADLVEVVKAEGVTTAEQFKALKAEHGTLKATEATRARQDLMRELAKAEGYDAEKAALLLADNPDVPEQIEFRDAQGGKKEAWAKVKGAGDALEAKPWADVVKGSAKLTALVPSLAAGVQTGTRVPGSTGGAGSSGSQKSVVDSFIENRDKAAASRPNPFSAKPAPAATA